MKTYVIILSRTFPRGHKRAGEETLFMDNLLNETKKHTIRAKFELWKHRIEEVQQGNAVLSIRQWDGAPYRSCQTEIVRLTREDGIGIQKLRIYEHEPFPFVYADRYTRPVDWQELANNDGLSLNDWREWFKDYDLSQPTAIIHFTKFRY